MSEDSSQRIAFIVNPLAGDELQAGSRDVSRIHLVLTDPKWGKCQTKNSKLKHECESKKEFNEFFSGILNNWRKQDQLIFYFSGHGDFRGSKYCLKLGLSDSDWFPFDSLMNELDINQVQKAILIIDACHSGAALEGTKNSDNIFNPIKKNEIPQGIAIIASSRKTQTSREFTDGSSSVFTRLFCEGIETSLDEIGTDDGYIYVENIITYIENKLNTDKNYSKFNQRPIFNINKANKGIWISKTTKRQLNSRPNDRGNKSNVSVKTSEELRILYENTLPNKHPCIEASVNDLDLEILKKYVNKTDPNLDLTNDLDEALLKLKLYSPIQYGDKNILHKSAVLCFYPRPELIYNQARSVFVVQNSKDSNFIREDIEGSLSYQIQTLVEKVRIYFRDIPKISYIAEDGLRQEVEDIELNVVRELISNAITHRDYQSTGTVKVTITPEALEVQSPGKFPDNLSWKDLINSEIQSKPVDAAISYYLSKLLVFEGIGNGFKLFKQYVQDNGSDSIVCKELPGAIISIRLLRRSQNLRTLIDVEELPKQQRKSNAPSNIVNRGTPHFIGREDLLEQLHQELQRKDQLSICAISGMGGVGKTELALQYALRYQESYPGGLCWLQVRGADLGTQIIEFARYLLDFNPPEHLDLISQVKYCWSHWREGKVLIILDDVVDYEVIRSYLPPAQPQFKVLITSRQRPNASIRRIELDVISLSEALDLLSLLVGQKRVQAELLAAESLSQWLGYLPLGLELVGRYLDQHPTLTIAKVEERLKNRGLEAKILDSPQENMTAQSGIATALELTWTMLSEEVQKLGCWLSLFAPAPFDWILVEQCLHDKDSEELEELRDGSLLKLHLLQLTEQNTYLLHSLIREFFQTKLSKLAEADNYKSIFCQTMVTIAKKIPQTPTLEQIKAVTSSIPHLTQTATQLIDWLRDEDIIWVFVGLGSFYGSQGAYQQAEEWYKQFIKVTKNRLGEEHPDVATSLNNLALLYQSQGRYDQAQPLYLQALELNRQLLGEQHLDVATSLNNLALLYQSQGRYYQAEPLYLQALELNRRLLGEQHPDVATSLNNLALLYQSQGRYDQAEPLYLQALTIRARLLGEQHPDIAISLNNLAGLYKLLKRYDEAEALYEKALTIRRQLLGEQHPDVATSLNNLALLYQSQGHYDQAEPLYLQALEIVEQTLGANNQHTINFDNNIKNLYKEKTTYLGNNGISYYHSGQYKQAINFYQKSLEIFQKIGDRQGEAKSLGSLGLAYYSLKEYQQAIYFYLQSLSIFQEVDDRQREAVSLNNLGDTYYSLEEYQQALDFYHQSLDIFQKIAERQSEAVSLSNLGNTYYSLEEYQQALDFYHQSLDIFQKIAERQLEASCWLNIGTISTKLGQELDAKDAYQNARQLYEAMELDIDIKECDEKLQNISCKNFSTKLKRLVENQWNY